MAVPEDVNATDLTQETFSTLDGNEQFIMFDNTEGKRATLDAIKRYILKDEHLFQIDTSAGSSTVDGALYAAINSFGWVSDVIS